LVDFNSICPLEWRYGSREMREIFSVENLVKKYLLVEKVLIVGLIKAGLVPENCIEIYEKCTSNITAKEIYTKEMELGHDIAALTYILGEKCGECGRYAHLGATSYDIVDTAWTLVISEALTIVKRKLTQVIQRLIELSKEYKNIVMVSRTHGQHAVPITVGFKFANYVYELSRSYERLCELTNRVVRVKMSGAVGTMAGWLGKGLQVEETVSKILNITPHEISTQVAPRDGFAELISSLAILASQLDRFALEIRELSRTEIGEMYESELRVGSSTMPHKRNPIIAERISGLAKVARSLVITALENIPLMHERDLTNSSSERILIPHAFLLVDQILEDMLKLLSVLRIDIEAIERNLNLTRGTIMSEAIMIKLVQKGLARHEAHKLLMEIVRSLKPGESFAEALLRNEVVSRLLSPEEIIEILNPRNYLGNYSELIDRALKYAEKTLSKC
jgi:adenylosuccinate lyase